MALYSAGPSATMTRRYAVVDLLHSGCPKVDELHPPAPFALIADTIATSNISST